MLVTCFIECWSYAPLSQPFKRSDFLFTNLGAHRAGSPLHSPNIVMTHIATADLRHPDLVLVRIATADLHCPDVVMAHIATADLRSPDIVVAHIATACCGTYS